MSFTTLSIVKAHLLSLDASALQIENVPVTLEGELETTLPHSNIAADSAVVKWDTRVVPLHAGPLTLSGYGKASMSSDHIVRGSVVVTLSDALATVYMEDCDYLVNHVDGNLHRIPGTTIPDNQTVQVYFSKCALFNPAADYIVDYAHGTVRRRSNSSIPDGATVLLDYALTAASLTEGLISQAILETDDLIMRSLSTEYNASSTNQGLQTGATQLVLATIARDMATEVLARGTTSDSGTRAKEWQNLSALYEARAWQTLRPFLDRYAVHSPERHTNA